MNHSAGHGCHSTVAHDDGELRAMQRRLGVCVLLTLPMWWLHAIAAHTLSMPVEIRVLQAVLGTVVVAWGAWPFVARGWGRLNMFTLVALSIGVAWLLSAALEAPAFVAIMLGATPASVEPVVYFETAATITVLVLVGQVLEQRARRATRASLTDLHQLLPPGAHRLRDDGSDEEVMVGQVQPGDRLRVRDGERVPVDGAVLEGRPSIDASWVTGESMPRECGVGDKVTGGTRNGPAAFVMRAEGVGEATVAAQVRRLVTEAQNSRSHAQRLADRVSAYFVPAILLVAALTVILWWQFGGEDLSTALVRGATVCIVACPCALGLATPVAVAVAVGRAATCGIIIRHVEALEALAQVDTMVVDKTGTLTMGQPEIATVVPTGAWPPEKLIFYAASLEQGSAHPLAQALVNMARRQHIALGHVTDCVATAGVGLRGHVDGHEVWLGKPDALGAQLLMDIAIQERLQLLNAHGQTLMLLLVDHKVEGIFGAADAVRPTTPQALAMLRAAGLDIVMLTGDNQTAALMVADTLNIQEVHADMLPQDKLRHVQALQAAGHKVAVAGDGINDAPALAQADVGMALARDAHIAMPQAGINLMHADLRAICTARRLSVATLRVVRQNLVLAFAYNSVAVPVAAGVLDVVGIALSPTWASAAMGASSLAVVLNALRLRRMSWA